MSRRALAILFVVFFVLCGLSIWLHWRAKPIRPEGPFPGDAVLAVDINQVAAFTVSSASATSRVARKDGRWVVESRYEYPADFRRIVEQLRSLADMKVGQVVRVGEADVTEFGLGPDQATTIRLEDSAGQKLTEVYIGNPRQAQREGGMAGIPEGVYVRVDTGPVLIVDMPLSATFGWTEAWLDREIVNVPADAVESVSVQTKDESYVLKVPRSGEYTMDGLASNETVETSAAGRLVRALSPLTQMDIADPAQDASEQGFDAASRVEFATRFGERYTVEIGGMRTQGGGRYVRLSARYQKPPTPETFEGVESGSDEFKKKVEEFEKDCAEREKKASELAAFLTKWVYIVPDYQVGNLTLRRSDLVKVEQPTEEHPVSESEGGQGSSDESSVESGEASEGSASEAPTPEGLEPPVLEEESEPAVPGSEDAAAPSTEAPNEGAAEADQSSVPAEEIQPGMPQTDEAPPSAPAEESQPAPAS